MARIARSLRLLSAISLIGVVVGCGENGEVASSGGPRLIDSQTLLACSAVSFPPFEFFEPGSREPVGSDVEIGHSIADRMGVDLKIIDTPFSALISSVKSDRCDFGLMSLFPTAERLEVVDVVTYVGAGSLFLVRGEDASKYSSPESFAGQRVSVLSGAIQVDNLDRINEDLAKAGKEPIEVVALDAEDAAQSALASGRVDAMLTDSVAASIRAKDSEGRFATVGDVLPPVGVDPALGFIVDKGNSNLSSALSAYVKEMYADGTIKAALDRYNAGAYLLKDPQYIGKIYS